MRKRITITRSALIVGALLFALASGACGDDDDDNPTSPAPTSTVPTFSTIQTQIFDSNCVTCHTDVGRTPPAGLNLKAGSSFANLVGVPSSASAGAVRVIPSNANGSYLVQKLEGTPGIVGLQMPRNNQPLSSAQILMIRDWINFGAVNN